MSRMVLAFLGIVVLPGPGRAQLDPERNQPYQLRVLLDVGKDQTFTPVFQEQLRRGIQDSLQGALGNMGDVEVVTPASLKRELEGMEPPITPERRQSIEGMLELWEKVAESGLLKALNDWREVSSRKTHMVQVRYHDYQFEIQARQYDGSVGMPSPIVRIARTADRALVVRTAGLLVARDFGMIGTVVTGSPGPEVEMVLKGSALDSVNHWVAKGDVFAIAAVTGREDSLRTQRVPEAVLQVIEEPKEGKCRCRVFHRYENPLGVGPAGYRCIKLGTTEALLKLRLVDDHGRPMGSLRLTITPAEPGTAAIDLATFADGFTRGALGPYRNLALVQVHGQGDKPLTGQIPVEIVGDRPVVIHVPFDPKAEQAGQHAYARKRLIGRLDESLLAVSGLVAEMNRASKDSKLREAMMDKARTAISNLATDLVNFKHEVALLKDSGIDVSPVRQRITALEQRQQDFRNYIAELERVIKEESDPKRAQWAAKWANARSLEKEAQFDDAIKIYDEVLKEGGQHLNDAGYVEKLKKDWELRNNDSHPKARKFIYEEWQHLKSPEELRAGVDRAKAALQTFIQLNDRMSPLMLHKANLRHAHNLAKREAELEGSSEADDAKELQLIAELAPMLIKLTDETRTFLQPNSEEKR